MKQIVLVIDDETASRLEQVAPSRSRKRSDFLRAAVRKALWELEEHATAEAYARRPDTTPAHVDPGVWEPSRRPTRKGKGKR